MHIHGQLYAPASEQALPQFELQVKQAARQRTSERPHSALHTCSAVSVLSALWLLIPHMGSLCALTACHESAISFVLLFQTPKNTNYENIFFSVHREKKAS